MSIRPRGRQFFFAPGPTNIPDRVLSAMHRPTIDFFDPAFIEVQQRVTEGIKTVLRTKQHVLFYAANGHGAWEAGLVNCFAPGDTVLVLESGHFSGNWSDMARELGLTVETLHADWRRGISLSTLETRLTADKAHAIKGILVVQSETATGLAHPIGDIRRAIDAAKHPALLLADTISSLASFDFRMDDWGVDIVVGGSQKGLMMITGLALTGLSEKALLRAEANPRAKSRRSYWDWAAMRKMDPQRFPGTTPVHLFYGLDESLKMIAEEGLDAVLKRHHRLASATRAAINHWGGGVKNAVQITAKGIEGHITALELLCSDATRASDSVSAILIPDGHDGQAFRRMALDKYNLALGGGLGPLAGRVFRIGHLGDLNEPMLLGALGTVELALADFGIPHQPGGVGAAILSLLGRRGAAAKAHV
jgi:alanine-glyoxylate transaminase / serine-glyoxylate transaminase / serine-pyruvate transaminase